MLLGQNDVVNKKIVQYIFVHLTLHCRQTLGTTVLPLSLTTLTNDNNISIGRGSSSSSKGLSMEGKEKKKGSFHIILFLSALPFGLSFSFSFLPFARLSALQLIPPLPPLVERILHPQPLTHLQCLSFFWCRCCPKCLIQRNPFCVTRLFLSALPHQNVDSFYDFSSTCADMCFLDERTTYKKRVSG